MSVARIETFKRLVGCSPPPDFALLRDVTRICEQMSKESAQDEGKLFYALTHVLLLLYSKQVDEINNCTVFVVA